MWRLIVAMAIVLTVRVSAEPSSLRVIINAKSSVTKADKRFVADAFLKKRTHWDDDAGIQPIDLGQKNSVREQFSHDVLDRDVASVRHYWAQLVFSGRGVPPPEVGSEAEVVKFVAAHAGAIGYVSAGTELKGVKVLEIE
jgi:ABC-type phosphate transport system substrate-binding protein